jgi:hypothetical protein
MDNSIVQARWLLMPVVGVAAIVIVAGFSAI